MANRFQTNQHRLAYGLIASRDGEYCLICKKGSGRVKLQIDHADNNPSNWEPDNLHLLCQEHNLQLRGAPKARKLRTIHWHSANNVCVREKKYGSLSSKVAKDIIDYNSGSAEMKANNRFEPLYTDWLIKHLPISKKEALNSGAYETGCSQMSCNRYLEKLTSAAGPLQEFKDGLGRVMVASKSEMNQSLGVTPEPNKQCGIKAASDTRPGASRKKRASQSEI